MSDINLPPLPHAAWNARGPVSVVGPPASMYTQQQMEDYARAAVLADRATRAPQQAEPAAVVGTQADVWRGYKGQWTSPGAPSKTVHMLRDLPDGTPLYTAPPQQAEPQQAESGGPSEKWNPWSAEPVKKGV